MRILQLRFKNLNSLSGEWKIDFTHPDYLNQGLFVITGTTGAGKSTILDALSLALYGRTPRLAKITKAENEIMSRHTSECFSEVVFSSKKGIYRCHWSQRRAYKKAEGMLQAIKYEMVDHQTNQILTTKKLEFEKKVIKYTGMDFDRFTRSMLLAQGGFAAFLQASINEKAPILEQITGTEIYSQISIQVHQRMTEEKAVLSEVEAKLDTTHCLTANEEAELQADLENQQENVYQIQQQINLQQEKQQWLINIAELIDALERLAQQQTDLTASQTAFEPQRQQWIQANKAQKIQAKADLLAQLKQDQNNEEKTLTALQQQELDLINQQNKAKIAYQEAQIKLIRSKEQQTELLILLKQVRQLDIQYQENKKPVSALEKQIKKSTIVINAIEESIIKEQQQLTEIKNKIAQNWDYLNQYSFDINLLEDFPLIQQQSGEINKLIQSIAQDNTELTQLDATLIKADKVYQEKQQAYEKQAQQLKQNETTLEQLQAKLKQQLDGFEKTYWQTEQARLKEQKDKLQQAIELAQNQQKNKADLTKVQQEQVRQQEIQIKWNDLFEKQTEKVILHEKAVIALEKEQALLQRIEKLSILRQQLEEGEACPLCGAKSHPYCQDSTPSNPKIKKDLNHAQKALKEAIKEQTNLEIKKAENKKDLAQIIENQARIQADLAQQENQVNMLLAPFSACLEKQNLATLQKETTQALDFVLAKAQQISTIEQQINRQQVQLNRQQNILYELKEETQHCSFKQQQIIQKKQALEQKNQQSNAQLNQHKAEMMALLKKYQIEFDLSQLNVIQATLSQRKQDWIESNQQQQDLIHQQQALKVSIDLKQTQYEQDKIKLAEEKHTLTTLNQALAELKTQRIQLFGTKETDKAERQMAKQIATQENTLESALKTQQIKIKQLTQAQHAIQSHLKTIEKRTAQIKASQTQFEIQLQQQGFKHEAEYIQACLSEPERTHLKQQMVALDEQQQALDAVCKDKQQQLKKYQNTPLTNQDKTVIETRLVELKQQENEINERIGALKQQLKTHQDNQKTQQKYLQAIEKQRTEYQRWHQLHHLIGSSDGKKFRNFAQGLTFEMVISFANIQLQKMSDRYLLIQNKTDPLNLKVIDSYQAGVLRSTKTLSGGESFIISLALALGLSQMSSQKVQIDCLFLDEGFAALDEESLDIALEMLANLQQTGKLIGVISHIGRLQERITTQIQVIPQKNTGKSILKGVGVS